MKVDTNYICYAAPKKFFATIDWHCLLQFSIFCMYNANELPKIIIISQIPSNYRRYIVAILYPPLIINLLF